MFLKKKETRTKSPVEVDHALPTMAFSSHDERGKPTDELLDISLEAIAEARKIDLFTISQRMKAPPYYPSFFPGEHYRLLAGLVKVLNPKRIIEIGTYQGLSFLSLKEHLSKTSSITTFDVISWENVEGTILKEEDFEDGISSQIVIDLSVPSNFEEYKSFFSETDLIFIDVTHDGVLEEKLYTLIKSVKFKKPPLLVFDDIRFFTMLKFWRNIEEPKLDLTSFGHWSGTGLVILE